MDIKYFIQIASTSLAHYFAGGIISPVKYITNKIPDIQDMFKNFILISTKKWAADNDCTIEIVLTNDEIASLVSLNTDYYLLNTAIPISRMANVFFTSQEQAATTIWNINNGAGFVPDHLLKTEEKKIETTAKALNSDIDLSIINVENLEKKLNAYNFLMGGFAFMQLGTNDPKDKNLNYSENYISTLAYFNRTIQKEYQNYNLQLSRKYHPLFSNEKSDIEKYKHYLGKTIGKELLEKIAGEEQIQLDSKFGVTNLANIPLNSILYVLGVMSSYGDAKPKSVADLVSAIVSGQINRDKVEEVTLIFGLHTGYKSLRNTYKTTQYKKVVKFTLQSKLDYYAIESLYQYAFGNNKISATFDYLSDVIPDKRIVQLFAGYTVYQILDTQVIAKKNDYIKHQEYLLNTLVSGVLSWFPKELIKTDVIASRLKALMVPLLNALTGEIKREYASKLQDAYKIIEIQKAKINELESEKASYKHEPRVDKGVNNTTSVKKRIKKKRVYAEAQKTGVQNMVKEESVLYEITLKEPKIGVDYKNMKRDDLRNIAKNMGISGISKCSKNQLIEKISAKNNMPNPNPNLF